ncbi:hypothetical protein CVT25_000590 [Psilocybe cyanescens]|uniref:Uncharacterized protein n=1 Tax=Psilocybe cyanescens TaxID=93625 RepID=A0A409XLU6_PSICY|nr:hypothetical protein CVT25_000590 [Psilocybe cyanescens]
MALPPGQQIQALFVSALFYGLYLTTLFHCLRWLIFTDDGWKVRKRISWTLLTVTIAIWALSTISKVLEIMNTIQVVVVDTEPKSPPPGSIGSTTALPWMAVVIICANAVWWHPKCSDANISTLLADAVLEVNTSNLSYLQIYRCWIIYDKSKRVVAFPIFLWIGGLMLTGLQAYWQIVQSASILGSWQPINMKVGPGTVLTPFWGSTIVLNGYATCKDDNDCFHVHLSDCSCFFMSAVMIVRRIYLVSSKAKASTSVHTLRFTMRVLVESGALYLAASIAHFVVWWTPDSYAISIISNINLAVIGIAFNLILIRVAQRRVEEDHAFETQGQRGPISDIRFTPSISESKGLVTIGYIGSPDAHEHHPTASAEMV